MLRKPTFEPIEGATIAVLTTHWVFSPIEGHNTVTMIVEPLSHDVLRALAAQGGDGSVTMPFNSTAFAFNAALGVGNFFIRNNTWRQGGCHGIYTGQQTV